MVIASCLRLGRDPFFEAIFGTNCSLKIVFVKANGSQNGPKMKTLGSYFSENVQNWKSVFGLRRRGRIAYEPILWSAQGDPKIEEKNEHISEPLFLAKNTNICENIVPKGLQKGDFISGVAPLGAVLGHVWCPKPFLTPKMSP